MELSHRFIETLLDKNKKEMKKIFGKKEKDIDYAIQLLRIAALLHDIGHLPFSHSGEDILDNYNHEDVACEIVKEPDFAKLIKEFSQDAPTLISKILGNDEIEPNLTILRKIISGEFDADRTDYLIRDSLHCGVEYGRFDYQRLLETVRIIPDDNGRYLLGIERGGIHTLESLIIARYLMFTQVYFHRTRRIFDYYLRKFFPLWMKNKKINIHDLTRKYDDIKMINEFGEIYNNKKKRGEDIWELSRRIVERAPHSCLYETHDNVKDHELEAIERLMARIERNHKELDIIKDVVSKNVHEFYTGKEHESTESLIDLPVVDVKANVCRLLRKESPIIENLPRVLRVARIYGDVKEPTKKVELRNEFAKMAKELDLC